MLVFIVELFQKIYNCKIKRKFKQNVENMNALTYFDYNLFLLPLYMEKNTRVIKGLN